MPRFSSGVKRGNQRRPPTAPRSTEQPGKVPAEPLELAVFSLPLEGLGKSSRSRILDPQLLPHELSDHLSISFSGLGPEACWKADWVQKLDWVWGQTGSHLETGVGLI